MSKKVSFKTIFFCFFVFKKITTKSKRYDNAVYTNKKKTWICLVQPFSFIYVWKYPPLQHCIWKKKYLKKLLLGMNVLKIAKKKLACIKKCGGRIICFIFVYFCMFFINFITK